jgi:hypothetical protein
MSEKGPMEKGQRWYRVLGLLHSDTPSYMVRRIFSSIISMWFLR